MWEACTGAVSWQDLQICGERNPRSRFFGRTCDPVGDPRWSTVLLKDCTPWKGPMLEQCASEGLHALGGTHAGEVCGGLSPMGGTPCWSRGRV